MGAQLVTIIVGFLLTTVLGGLWAYYFQRRSWDHQYRVQLDERARDRAISVFEEVSRLLDKRLYRMRLLYWSLTDESAPGAPTADDRMADYRDVLVEWNDGINRILALVQHSYGPVMRQRLDGEIGSEFVSVGRTLQEMWRTGHVDESTQQTAKTRLRGLGGLVYHLNLDMLTALDPRNGSAAPGSDRTPTRGKGGR